MPYDLQTDPEELHDIGADPAQAATIRPADRRVNGWARGQHNRVTISDDEVARRAGGELRRGYVIGFWDQAELDAAWAEGSSGN